MFELAPDRRRKIAAFLSFFVLVQGFVVLGNAQPANAHHSEITASAACVNDVVILTATATAWQTSDPEGRQHPNVIIEARRASSTGDWTQIGTGAFTEGDYSFTQSYDVELNQPSWLGEDVNVRVRTPGPWANGSSPGDDTRYANGGNITSIGGATDIPVPTAEDCITESNPSCEDAFQLPQIVKDDNPGSGDKTLVGIDFDYSNPKEAGEYLNVAVSWSTDQYEVGGIIVKAGPGANTYPSPASGTVFDTVARFGISHVTVCGTEQDQPQEVTLQIGGSCELGDQGVTFSATGYQGVTGVESVTFYDDAAKQPADEVDPTNLPGPGTYYYSATAGSGYTISNPTGQFTVTDDCTTPTTVEVALGQCEFEAETGSTTPFSVVVGEGATFTLFDNGSTEVLVPANLAPGDYSWTVTTDPGYELVDTTINGESQDVDDAGQFTIGECDPLAGLGDYVWFDLDLEGDQDEDEPVEGVTATLFTGAGIEVASTTTDGSGYYEFTGLAAGDYYVEFELPSAGFTGFTVQDSTADGADDTTDSDVDPSGRSQTVTLAPGEFNETIDAGLVAIPQCPLEQTEGSILVDGLYLTPGFRDGNDQSLLSSGSLRYGFQWVTGPVVPPGVYDVTLVGYDNHFFFGDDGQDSERYYVTGYTGVPGAQGTSSAGWGVPTLIAGPSADVPAGADYSPAVTIDEVAVTDTLTHFSTVHYVVGSGESAPDIGSVIPTCVRFDPVEPETASLGDFVWEDLDRDGIQDLGEPGVEGVQVNLWESDGGVPDSQVASTTTDANGEYRFDGLLPGQEYVVQFVNPNGTTYVGFSPANAGANDALDSDANPANGITGPVVLDPGEYDSTIDAGLTPRVRPVLECWQYDPFEDAYFGYFGYRNEGTGPVPVASVPSTVTPGEFTSAFPTDGVFEPGRSPFYPDAAITIEWTNFPDDVVWNLDGRTATLGTDGPNCFEPAELGDFVWFDVDGDGIQDDGEPGIEGVTVNLWSSVEGEPGEILLTQRTDADGGYLFGDLPPGAYFVQFELPEGFEGFTVPDQGGDDTVDSDADPTTGITSEVVLAAGDADLTIDAGLVVDGPQALTVVCELTEVEGELVSLITIDFLGAPGTTVEILDGDTVVDSVTLDASGEGSLQVEAGTYSWQALFEGEVILFVEEVTFEDCAPEIVDEFGFCVNDGPYLEYDIDAALAPGTVATGVDLFFFAEGYAFSGGEPTDDDLANAVTWYEDVPFEGIVVWPGAAGQASDGTVYDGRLAAPVAAGDVVVTGITSDLTAIAWPGWVEGPDGSFDGPDAGPFADVVNGQVVARVNPLSGSADLIYPPRTENCVPLASLGDYVWEDLDQDGIQDQDEVPVPGVEVTLLADGVEVATTTTNEDGLYLFTDLPSFNADDEEIAYQVRFALPGGYVGFTMPLEGDDPAVDSDADPETGLSPVVTLAPGEINLSIDAGVTLEVEQVIEEEDDEETLPETGYDSGRLALIGVLALGLGGTIVATTRRREDGEAA